MQNKIQLNKIYCGDAIKVLEKLPSKSVDCVVTSPPYWALRDYKIKGQLGLEKDFDDYINKLCDVFCRIKRVLKDEGTCWVNLGDTYYSKSGSSFLNDKLTSSKRIKKLGINKANELRGLGLLKEQNLTLIPFRFALEMQRRGWIIRNVIIWHKPNCMPCSARNRFTVDFEYLFFFVKNKKYYFETQYEPLKEATKSRLKYKFNFNKGDIASAVKTTGIRAFQRHYNENKIIGRHKRCVWTISPSSFKGKHYATFPEKLIEIPILAGCPKNGIVLDPFIGSGTTGVVCKRLKRKILGIDIKPQYCKLSKKRIWGAEYG
jgi:DNA modification methylase